MVLDRVGNAKAKLSHKTKNGEVRKSRLSMFDSVRSSSSAVSVSQSSSGGDDTGKDSCYFICQLPFVTDVKVKSFIQNKDELSKVC